jgi:hypothetical protein
MRCSSGPGCCKKRLNGTVREIESDLGSALIFRLKTFALATGSFRNRLLCLAQPLLRPALCGNMRKVMIMSNEFNGSSAEEKAEIDALIKHLQDSGLDAVKPLDLLRGVVGNPYERYKQAQATLRWGRPAFVLMKAGGLDVDKVTIGELGREVTLERLIELRGKLK